MKIQYGEHFDPSHPDVGFALYPEQPFSSETRTGLEELIRAWFKVGSLGGYGHGFHDMSEIVFREQESRPVVEWRVGMGDEFNPMALEVLRRMLDRWARLQTWSDGQIMNVGVAMKAMVVGTDFIG